MINEGRVLFCNSVFVEDPRKLKEEHLFRHKDMHKLKVASKEKVRQILELGGKKRIPPDELSPSLGYLEMAESFSD